jgi:hypothetical protein
MSHVREIVRSLVEARLNPKLFPGDIDHPMVGKWVHWKEPTVHYGSGGNTPQVTWLSVVDGSLGFILLNMRMLGN